jgi:mRNA interferase MazF
MVTPGPASIVVVQFPFSDLSGAKLRPAVVLVSAGRGDWVLCQITSNPHSDPQAIKLTPATLRAGALADVSFARPTKLFTAHDSLMAKRVAILGNEPFKEILLTTIAALQKAMPR